MGNGKSATKCELDIRNIYGDASNIPADLSVHWVSRVVKKIISTNAFFSWVFSSQSATAAVGFFLLFDPFLMHQCQFESSDS